MNKISTIVGFCLISAFLFLGARAINSNLSPLFDQVEKQMEEGRTVVMNGEMDAPRLDTLLRRGGYVTDPQDAKFISEWYKERIAAGKPLENLGAINGKAFRIPDDTIRARGGEELKSRLAAELEMLGQDSLWKAVDAASLASTFGTKSDSTALIRVYVGEAQEGKRLGLFPKGMKDVAGVTVRITRHWADSVNTSGNLPVSHGSRTLGYAVTDRDGTASFYVPKGHSYSVLPISKGHQYGQEKGTTEGPLVKDLGTLRFSQRAHALRPFRGSTYARLKSDKALIARSPAQFRSTLNTDILVFVGCWLLVFVATAVIDRHRGKQTDPFLLLPLMALTGMGLLTLFGQMMPLSDIFYAHKMVDVLGLSGGFSGGIVIGCLLLVLLSNVNYLKLYQRYRSHWTRYMGLGKSSMAGYAPGLPFVFLAVLLMLMLRLMGSGPEGSDARVNLFGFQPSEVVKYLIVVFLAFFLVAQGDVIKTFGTRLTTLARRRYVGIVSGVAVVIAVVSFLFLAMLKDMGPGIVVLITFVLLYSTARRDMPQLLLGIISYIIVTGAAYMLTSVVAIRLLAVTVWFVMWIAWSWTKRRTVYESAIFFNVVVSLFLVGEHLVRPFLPHMADRLANRTHMSWGGIFDNAIPQGDQIAQGLWGTASGGFSGMGPGGGSSYFIPAGHTDLILNSLGEQMGWMGILVVVVCFYILISRTTVAAQYSGNKFTFYLCLGLGLLTGVQFLFIALGCVGVLPLSGVPVPFMSYSGTGAVMALAAYGVVLSVSRHRGSPEALKSFVVNERRMKDNAESIEAKSLEKSLFAGMLLLFAGCVGVAAVNAYYQLVVPGKTQLRPSITSTAQGMRVLGYNPRIRQVINMLERGDIYDRNGLLLATSDYDKVRALRGKAGYDPLSLEDMLGKELRRYYPFGGNTVFMVGDLNHADVYANYGTVPIGYFAETREADRLLGYDTKPRTIELSGSGYKYSRFLDPVQEVGFKYQLRDYSALLPALSTPLYRNKWIKDFNASRENRDIRLTMDAVLQTKMQSRMARHIRETPGLAGLRHLRASVVVLDAASGELLTSSCYPLPVTDSIVSIRELGLERKGGAPSEWRRGAPVTERDLGLTYQTAPGSTAKVMTAIAGYNKLGMAAYDRGFEIQPYMSIEPIGDEPNVNTKGKNRNGGRVTYMENAIKYSSNCYYVMLLNEDDLYRQAGDVYWVVGAKLHRAPSYFFSTGECTDAGKQRFDDAVFNYQASGLEDYNRYIHRKPRSKDKNPREDNMSSIQQYTGIAWGQSTLEASPLNMARVAGLVANGGKLAPTRYLMGQPAEEGVSVMDAACAASLASAMEGEASKHIGNGRLPQRLEGQMGGKTGTPMRDLGGATYNDAWYICFIKGAEQGRTLAIAVRLERLPKGITSTYAVDFVNKAVLPALQECNYIK